MHQNSTNANRVGRLNNALRGVPEEAASEAVSLPSSVDREPRQNDDRNWVGHIGSKAAGYYLDCDRTRSQRIVADDTVVFTDYISSRGSTELIGPRPPP